MSDAIVVQKTFEERMKERIKDSIGELMSDEELKKLVHKSLDQVFFQSTQVKDGWHTKEVPPLLNGIIKELLTPQVREAVIEYIDKHPDEIQKAVKDALSVGMGNALLNAFNNQFQNQLIQLQSRIENTMLSR